MIPAPTIFRSRATVVLAVANAPALILAGYLLLRYGHAPLPLASPDEFRFDVLPILMILPVVYGLAINSAALIAALIWRRPAPRNSAKMAALGIVCWLGVAGITLIFSG